MMALPLMLPLTYNLKFDDPRIIIVIAKDSLQTRELLSSSRLMACTPPHGHAYDAVHVAGPSPRPPSLGSSTSEGRHAPCTCNTSGSGLPAPLCRVCRRESSQLKHCQGGGSWCTMHPWCLPSAKHASIQGAATCRAHPGHHYDASKANHGLYLSRPPLPSVSASW